MHKYKEASNCYIESRIPFKKEEIERIFEWSGRAANPFKSKIEAVNAAYRILKGEVIEDREGTRFTCGTKKERLSRTHKTWEVIADELAIYALDCSDRDNPEITAKYFFCAREKRVPIDSILAKIKSQIEFVSEKLNNSTNPETLAVCSELRDKLKGIIDSI